VQYPLDPVSEYGRSGSVLLLNPTDRDLAANYDTHAADLRTRHPGATSGEGRGGAGGQADRQAEPQVLDRSLICQ
jgi:hypothetical protein